MASTKELTKDCGLIRELDQDIRDRLKDLEYDLSTFTNVLIGKNSKGEQISIKDVFVLSLYLYGAPVHPKRDYSVIFECNLFTDKYQTHHHERGDNDIDADSFDYKYKIQYEYKPISDEPINPYHFQLSIVDENEDKIPKQIRNMKDASSLPKELKTKKTASKYLEILAKHIIGNLGDYLNRDPSTLTKWDDKKTPELVQTAPEDFKKIWETTHTTESPQTTL